MQTVVFVYPSACDAVGVLNKITQLLFIGEQLV